MIILLEGADGCGKTTLANKLVKDYGAVYHHCSVTDNIYQLHKKTVEACLADNKRLHVIDRLYPSERVYSSVFRSGESYDTDHFATTFEHKLVWCNIPVANFVEHHVKFAEREMYKTNMMDVYLAYQTYFDKHLPDYVYDYTSYTETMALELGL